MNKSETPKKKVLFFILNPYLYLIELIQSVIVMLRKELMSKEDDEEEDWKEDPDEEEEDWSWEEDEDE